MRAAKATVGSRYVRRGVAAWRCARSIRPGRLEPRTVSRTRQPASEGRVAAGCLRQEDESTDNILRNVGKALPNTTRTWAHPHVPVFADDQAGLVRGLEGLVVQRQGMMEVVLRLDFIGQAAAVKVMADEVEPV